MKTRMLLFFIALSSAVAALADDQFVLPPETTNLKPGDNVELVKARCLLCHSADYISTQPPLSDTAWKAIVQKMQTKFGAPIAPTEIDTLVSYLAKPPK